MANPTLSKQSADEAVLGAIAADAVNTRPQCTQAGTVATLALVMQAGSPTGIFGLVQ